MPTPWLDRAAFAAAGIAKLANCNAIQTRKIVINTLITLKRKQPMNNQRQLLNTALANTEFVGRRYMQSQ